MSFEDANGEKDVILHIVNECLNKIAPLEMADTSWDNVGLQIQAAHPHRVRGGTILLTHDLTSAVVDEALQMENKVDVIVTYHPIIFRGLKSITMADSQQRSLLRLAHANISVIAMHTALDAATHGINDWLARVVQGRDLQLDSKDEHLCPPIVPLSKKWTEHPNAGQGRIVQLQDPAQPSHLVNRIKAKLSLNAVLVGVPQRFKRSGEHITSVAVAAGSGSSILAHANGVDAYVTGEMSHHEVLAAVQRGIVVILLLHGNSERQFLADVLQSKLQKKIDAIDRTLGIQVAVSQKDAEPLQIM